MPLIALIFYFWKIVIQYEIDRNKKFLFLLSSIGILIWIIPCFVFFCDWTRWEALCFTTPFVFISYYLHMKNESVIRAIAKISDFAKKHIFISLMFVIYLLILGRVSADASMIVIANRINILCKYIFLS
jgi:hypothetical protein